MSLSQFTDLVSNTTSVGLNSPTKLRNHVNRNGYALPYVLRGAEGFKSLQGGKDIRFDNYFNEVSTYRNYKPGEKQTWSNPQITTSASAPWRFSMDEMTYDLNEVMMQSNEMSAERRALYFVETQAKVEMKTIVSMAHGLEDELFALPDWSEMEHADGRTPNSLNVFCNEMVDGLYHSYRTTGGGNGNVLNVDTTLYSNWDNQRVGYTRKDGHATGSGTHLFAAFDEIMLDLSFQQVPGPDGGMVSEAGNAYGMKAVFTQKAGVTNFMNALRVNNDYFRMGAQEAAYPHPVFNGIPIIRISTLDTAEIYPTVGTAANGLETSYGVYSSTANTAEANAGPRYHFIDFTVTQKAVHEQRYFYKHEDMKPSNQVDVKIQPVLITHNNICQERRKCGIVFPIDDIS